MIVYFMSVLEISHIALAMLSIRKPLYVHATTNKSKANRKVFFQGQVRNVYAVRVGESVAHTFLGKPIRDGSTSWPGRVNIKRRSPLAFFCCSWFMGSETRQSGCSAKKRSPRANDNPSHIRYRYWKTSRRWRQTYYVSALHAR